MSRRIVRITITGRVQGVGYRYFCQREAQRLDICGWAENRFDGSVEALASGSEVAVEAFLAVLRSGPRLAQVEALDVREAKNTPVGESFQIR